MFDFMFVRKYACLSCLIGVRAIGLLTRARYEFCSFRG